MGSAANKPMTPIQAWSSITRISNAPTVISNVMVGLGIAIQAHAIEFATQRQLPPLQIAKPLLIITVALLSFYFAGMVLNDAIDETRDKKHRSNRPIPSGLITKQQAWITGLIFLFCGIAITATMSSATAISGMILGTTVLLYTFAHQWEWPAITLMGICRGLVYVVAFYALTNLPSPHLMIFAAAIFLYTAILTWLGKHEHKKEQTRSSMVWLAVLPVAFVSYVTEGNFGAVSLVAVVFVCWIGFASKQFAKNKPTGGMHTLLSGFCLLDCLFLAALEEYSIMIISFICFIFTIAGHRKILGT